MNAASISEMPDSTNRRYRADWFFLGRPIISRTALRPVSRKEAAVFHAVLSGRFLLKGFTNRDLRECLGIRRAVDERSRRRQSARITRLLRLLRAHRLIRKVSGTRYYRVTAKGRRTMTAALKLRDVDGVLAPIHTYPF